MTAPLTTAVVALVLLGLHERERPRLNIFGRVVNSAADRVDIDAILADIDVNALLDNIDVDGVLDRVDVNALLDRVDPNRLLDRVDANRLLDRVDVDRLLDRVDVNRLMDRVDVDRIMARVDVDDVVQRAGIADIVAEGTGAVAGSVLDVARRQLVVADSLADRVVFRLTARDPEKRPGSPTGLTEREIDETGRAQVTGHYAGPVTRLLAFALDTAIVVSTYTLLGAGAVFLAQLFGLDDSLDRLPNWAGLLLLVLWATTYSIVGLALAGKTIGKAVLGLRVVAATGLPLRGHQPLTRTLALPFSFILGIGILMGLVHPRRATLHDRIARTAEVYDWGERPAELPAPFTAWLMERQGSASAALALQDDHRIDP